MNNISGGAVLAKALSNQGVNEVFTLHGGHLDSFLIACADENIRLTDTRHEATAGYAAASYSRATGKIGVCVVTAGPGFTNAVTALTDAWLDATPMLCITGSPPLREAATNPLQGGFDQVAMVSPVTKWSHRITNVERIPDLVDKAIRLAMTGRPGPVYLEVPIDIMFGLVPSDEVILPGQPKLVAKPCPSTNTVEAILDLLAKAERPVIIVGGGTTTPQCSTELDKLATLTGTPVIYNGKANGVLPFDHVMNFGGVGTLAVTTLAAGKPADLVIQIGARSGLLLGGRSGRIVSEGAIVVQIDIDGSEIGRLRAPEIAVTADAGETLCALHVAAQARVWPARHEWYNILKKCRDASHLPFKDAPVETSAGLIHPYHAARAVAEALSPDTAIVLDGGEAVAWYQMFGRSPGPGLYATNGYLGTLGIGQGSAIGMARARPGRPVAALMGDGAIGFHIAEFDAFARHDLPIVLVVFTNGYWGMSLHGQELVFGSQHLAAVKLEQSAYELVAQGLGCKGERVTRFEDIGPAIRRAQVSGKPACINILTDPAIAHPVTASMIGNVDAEGEIAIPYYENIPIRR